MPTFLIETYSELLPYAKSEVRKILGEEAKELPQLDRFLEVEIEDLETNTLQLLFFGNSFTRLYLKVGEGKATSQKDLYDITREAFSWHELWSEDNQFAVVPETDDSFPKVTIGKEVGQAVVDDFKGEGKDASISLDSPDIPVLAKVKGDYLTVAIDLTGRDINTELEILNQSILLYSGWENEEKLGEIYHAGLSKLAYEHAKRIPKKDKVSGTTLPNLTIVDKNRLLHLVRKNWELQTFPQISCFEEGNREEVINDELINEGKIDLHDLEDLPEFDVPFFVSNLVERKPDRAGERALTRKIAKKLAENDSYQNFTFLVRADVNLPKSLKGKRRKAPQFRGIDVDMIKSPP